MALDNIKSRGQRGGRMPQAWWLAPVALQNGGFRVAEGNRLPSACANQPLDVGILDAGAPESVHRGRALDNIKSRGRRGGRMPQAWWLAPVALQNGGFRVAEGNSLPSACANQFPDVGILDAGARRSDESQRLSLRVKVSAMPESIMGSAQEFDEPQAGMGFVRGAFSVNSAICETTI